MFLWRRWVRQEEIWFSAPVIQLQDLLVLLYLCTLIFLYVQLNFIIPIDSTGRKDPHNQVRN